MLNVIADKSEFFKGVCTVLITSFTHKIVKPRQDIRKHQSSMPRGYSGRSVDTKSITPFLKAKKLTHMEESGWLTRSLEHNSPYNFKYNGKINDKEVKEAFLTLLDNIETKSADPKYYLDYLLQKLILLRDHKSVQIADLENPEIFIDKVVSMLEQHFQNATGAGTARLPVLAVYSVYECIVNQLERYQNKTLSKLKSHTSADSKSGDIGDVQINYNSQPFEGVEIKYEIAITPQLINDSYRKMQQYSVNRYYILSTVEPSLEERKILDQEIAKIAKEHGCQFIVNGLLATIKYYLRLVSSPVEFVNNYSQNLINDTVIKTEHRELWRKIIDEAQITPKTDTSV